VFLSLKGIGFCYFFMINLLYYGKYSIEIEYDSIIKLYDKDKKCILPFCILYFS